LRKLYAAAILAALCLLSGCSDFFYPVFTAETPSPSAPQTPEPIGLPPARSEVNTFGIPYYPVETFQPLTDVHQRNGDVARLCYEGLVELNVDFTPEPVLASRIQTADNITYTVTLNPRARFSNGAAVQAADVKYSYDLARESGDPYAERLQNVKEVSISGENAVIVMKAPVFNAEALMDIPVVQNGGTGAAAIGTGPYTVHLTGEEGRFLLQNEAWWRSKDPLPIFRIELVPATGPGELLIGFGQTYISLMPLDVYDSFAPGIKGNCDKTQYPTPLMQYVGFNMANSALQKPEVRRALSLALDRAGIVRKVYGGLADAACLPVPPGAALYRPEIADALQYKPKEAARVLDEAGIADNDGDGYREFGRQTLALSLIVDSGSDERARAAKIYAAALRTLGVRADVRVLGWDVFLAAIEEGEYDLYYAEALPLPNLSPREICAEGGAFNLGGFKNAEMSQAIAALESAAPEKQEEALTAVWEQFAEQTPVITVCFRKMQMFSQFGKIEGLSPNYYNPYHGWKDLTIHK